MNGVLNSEDLLQARRMLAAMVDLGDTAHDDEGATRRRIDILERMIEVLRYELEYPDNKLPFERFVNGAILVDDGVIHYRPGQCAPFGGIGTRAYDLQPRLLIYLLVNHGLHGDVYSAIHGFVRRHRPILGVLDFKRTRTGVVRCFTNTRTAARTLRRFGLLRYTCREAYKTWELSLRGLLVAAILYRHGHVKPPESFPTDLVDAHPLVRTALLMTRTFDRAVAVFQHVCEKGRGLYASIDAVAREVERVRRGYRAAIRERLTMRPKEDERLSTRALEVIESHPAMPDFKRDLSMALQIEDVLAGAVRTRESGHCADSA